MKCLESVPNENRPGRVRCDWGSGTHDIIIKRGFGRAQRLVDLQKQLGEPAIHAPGVEDDHSVPYGTDPGFSMFQAFHAWLPSIRPSGTPETDLSLDSLRPISRAFFPSPRRGFSQAIISGALSRFLSLRHNI
jgi:hypothetical protein